MKVLVVSLVVTFASAFVPGFAFGARAVTLVCQAENGTKSFLNFENNAVQISFAQSRWPTSPTLGYAGGGKRPGAYYFRGKRATLIVDSMVIRQGKGRVTYSYTTTSRKDGEKRIYQRNDLKTPADRRKARRDRRRSHTVDIICR